ESSIAEDAKAFSSTTEWMGKRYDKEPFRQKLLFIQAKLRNTLEQSDGGKREIYSNSTELRADLMLLYKSLREFGLNQSLDSLERTISAIDIFGFHLAKLDIRQHSGRHLTALDEITSKLNLLPKSYAQCTEEQKYNWLRDELITKRPLF